MELIVIDKKKKEGEALLNQIQAAETTRVTKRRENQRSKPSDAQIKAFMEGSGDPLDESDDAQQSGGQVVELEDRLPEPEAPSPAKRRTKAKASAVDLKPSKFDNVVEQLAATKRKGKAKPRTRITFDLDYEMYELINRAADLSGVSVAEIMRRAVRNFFEE